MAQPAAAAGRVFQFKLVLLGDSAVGKSSLVLRFVRGQFFEYQESTIGAAFLTQTVALNDTTVKFEIWDTAGQERYHSLAPMYYRGAAAAIVVYDITNRVRIACCSAHLSLLPLRAKVQAVSGDRDYDSVPLLLVAAIGAPAHALARLRSCCSLQEGGATGTSPGTHMMRCAWAAEPQPRISRSRAHMHARHASVSVSRPGVSRPASRRPSSPPLPALALPLSREERCRVPIRI